MAGEDGQRMKGMLRGITGTASVLLSQKEGDVGKVVEVISGMLRARK